MLCKVQEFGKAPKEEKNPSSDLYVSLSNDTVVVQRCSGDASPAQSIYASTKCASLMLFQALQIEHPSINFTFVLPATIEGNFRASAVDNPPNWTGAPKVHEADPNKHGLKREVVARQCICVIDILCYFRAAQVLYWLWPALIEWRARVKYNFRHPRVQASLLSAN
ncbi:hypothetical protein EDD15DRAFT_2445475 [Pisolithus albus]|nr:hypothetical protein EDD15DRAFT_2445475 [Pisolithus albus]